MLKFKDSKKQFSIIYDSDDMTEHRIVERVLNEEERELINFSDMRRGNVFVLDSDTDIEEWEDMSGIYCESEFNNIAEDFGMLEYFEIDANVVD